MLNPDSRSLMGKLNSLTFCIFWLQCSLLWSVLYEYLLILCFLSIIYCLAYIFLFPFQEEPLDAQMFCSVLFWLSKCLLLSSWNVLEIIFLEAATRRMHLHVTCQLISKKVILLFSGWMNKFLSIFIWSLYMQQYATNLILALHEKSSIRKFL